MSDLRFRNHDAEQAVLAAMFIEPVAIVKARGLLTADDFDAAKHRLLYAAMCELAAAGSEVDPLTMTSHLSIAGTLEAAGGRDYIGFLVDAIPTAANVGYHAELVRECAARRRLVETIDAAKLAITTGADDSLTEIAGRIQAAVSSAVTKGGRKGYAVVTGDEIITLADSLMERRTATEAGRIVGVATGYPEIDDVLYGLRPAELVIVAARPKCGKTGLCLNVAVNAIVDDGHAGGFVSTEMLRDELLERAGNRLAQLTTHQTAAGRVDDRDVARFATTLGQLAGKLHIDDEAFPTLDDVIARSIDLKARHPEIAFLVVDYLQRITKRMKGRRGDEELAAVTQGMKALAKELRIPIIAPAQVNYKDSDKRESKAPTLADIQGGSSFAQDGNFVFLLHRPALFDADPSLAHVLQVELAASRRTKNFTTALDWHGDMMAIDSPRRRARRATAPLTFPDRRSA